MRKVGGKDGIRRWRKRRAGGMGWRGWEGRVLGVRGGEKGKCFGDGGVVGDGERDEIAEGRKSKTLVGIDLRKGRGGKGELRQEEGKEGRGGKETLRERQLRERTELERGSTTGVMTISSGAKREFLQRRWTRKGREARCWRMRWGSRQETYWAWRGRSMGQQGLPCSSQGVYPHRL